MPAAAHVATQGAPFLPVPATGPVAGPDPKDQQIAALQASLEASNREKSELQSALCRLQQRMSRFSDLLASF